MESIHLKVVQTKNHPNRAGERMYLKLESIYRQLSYCAAESARKEAYHSFKYNW